MTTNRQHLGRRTEPSGIVIHVPDEVGQYIKEAFLVALLTYIVFTLIDRLVPGFISRVFNLDIVLGAVIILGVATAWLVERERNSTNTPPAFSWRNVGLIAGSGLAAAVIVWLRTTSLGWVNLPLSVMSGLIVAGLTWFFLDSDTLIDHDISH